MQYSKSSSSLIKSKGLRIFQEQGQQDLLALHQSNPKRYPFLLESVARSDSSQFDILFAFPQETLTLSNNEELSGYSDTDGNNFLNNLSRWWETERNDLIECETLPFFGGWFLYLGYELAKQVEPQLKLKKSITPIAYATRIPAAVIYDHKEKCTYYICEEKFDYLEQLKADSEQVEQSLCHSPLKLSEINEEDENQYLKSIKKVKKYIIDGDIFQANLSRLWTMKVDQVNAVDLYNKLRETNPAPFSGLAVHNDFSIISSSPERLIRVKNGLAETRPRNA